MSSSTPAFQASVNHEGSSSSQRSQFSSVHSFTSPRIDRHILLLQPRISDFASSLAPFTNMSFTHAWPVFADTSVPLKRGFMSAANAANEQSQAPQSVPMTFQATPSSMTGSAGPLA
jgi:hypothetical protein